MTQKKMAEINFEEADTFPKMLMRNYQKWGDTRTALRKKRYGIWGTYSWKDYYDNVKSFSLGLISLGLKSKDTVAILGDNDPEWWYAALAVQSAGAIEYGIFVDCLPAEVQEFVNMGGARFVIAKDQEQCDKLLEEKSKIPNVKKIIFWDPKGMWSYNDSILMEFKEVLSLGVEYGKAHPNHFENNIKKGEAKDIACLCFTSGTTGKPKPSMLSYKTFCCWSESLWKHFPWYEEDDYFSSLCPAWTADQWLGIGTTIMVGAVVNFAEEPDTVREDGREIAGHFHISGARAWEDLYREIQMRITDADKIKQYFYKIFLPIGYKIADFHYQNKTPSFYWKLLYKIGDRMVFRPIRDILGLTRSRACLVAGAMLSPDLFRFWKAVGVPLYTQYSLTETGYGSIEAAGQMKQGSAGKIIPERNVKISEKGEILFEVSHSNFAGYYKNPKATAELIKGNWLFTGDSGYIDEEGYLFFNERMSELSSLLDGSEFSPTYIEAKLRFSSYLKDVMVIGAGKEFVAALIDIDLGNCGKWAEKKGIAYTTRIDLSQKQEVYDLIKKEIEAVNKTIEENLKIKSFVNLHKGFDADEDELTRTRKLKRSVLSEKYETIINAIYTPNEKEVQVQTDVKYRDGRTGVLTTKLKIATIS